MKNIKLDTLFTAIGYSNKIWRGTATAQLQRVGISKKDAQALHFLDEETANKVLKHIGSSTSKYKTVANDLIGNLTEDFFCDDNYQIQIMSKTAKATNTGVKKDHITSDLKSFIEFKGISIEEFDTWRTEKYTK